MKGAIVTGGSSGIGAAVCLELAKRNFRIFMLGRNVSALEKLTKDCECTGGEASFGVGDVGDTADVKRLYQEAIVYLKQPPHVLVLSAGVGRMDAIGTASVEDFDLCYRTNVRGVFLWLTQVVPDMKALKRGQIVGISSTVGLRPKPNVSIYSSTKAAVQSIFGSLRQELEGTGVKAGTICPGPVSTVWWNDFERGGKPFKTSEEQLEKYLTPEDVAQSTMVFVDQSGNMNMNVIDLPYWE
eukprot:CFRG3675T1